MGDKQNNAVANFAAELRKYWRFDDHQRHTHTWHTREDFIEQVLPKLLVTQRLEGEISEAKVRAAAEAILHRRGFGFYTDPMEGGQDAYDISCEALEEARAALEAARDTP